MLNLGERLYELRTKNNMSQGDLAERLDVSRQTISKWENNMCLPEAEKLVMLSEIFSVSADYILKGAEYQKEAEPVYIYVKENEGENTAESKEKTTRKYVGLTLAIVFGLITVIFLLLSVAGFWILAIPTGIATLIGIFIYKDMKHPWFVVSWIAFLICIPVLFFCTAINPTLIFNPDVYRKEFIVHLLFSYGFWSVLIALVMWSVKIKRGYIFRKK